MLCLFIWVSISRKMEPVKQTKIHLLNKALNIIIIIIIMIIIGTKTMVATLIMKGIPIDTTTTVNKDIFNNHSIAFQIIFYFFIYLRF